MEKQKKVIKNIKYESGQKTPLGTKKNDEMYTRLQDILNELENYNKKHFYNVNGLSPFDWDLFSDYPEIYGVKLFFNSEGKINNLICYGANKKNEKILADYDFVSLKYDYKMKQFKINEKLVSSPKCNFLKAIVYFAKKWKIKSWTFSGYNPYLKCGIDAFNYDFSEYDVIITNPPFTRMKDFLQKVMNEKVHLICLSNFLDRVNPKVGLWLYKGNLILGYNRHVSLSFENYTIGNIIEKRKDKKVACDWITTYTDEDTYDNFKKYSNGFNFDDYKDEYSLIKSITMKDHSHPIWIKKSTALPDDYKGWFFSSVGLFDKFNPKNFEWYGTNFKKYFNTERFDLNPCIHKFSNNMVRFHGILAKRK